MNDLTLIEGDLGLFRSERLWDPSPHGVLQAGRVHGDELHDGQRCWHRDEWETVSSEEEGFEDYDEMAVLLRRKRDGLVIEVDIEPTVRVAEPRERE